MIPPRTLGACTSLTYLASFVALCPDYMIRVKLCLINRKKYPMQLFQDYFYYTKLKNILWMILKIVDLLILVHYFMDSYMV